ncbi:GNAT family N-acetyltransferase [Nocardia tengchongensis]|uniref:GNAT family N-acetyltransferase n=1 Tax=Nocardia tengchongensis TaxID=2055889 RepID=UPI0036BE5BA8
MSIWPRIVRVRESSAGDVEALATLKAGVEDATYSRYGTAEEHRISQQDFCSADYIRGLGQRGTVLVAEESDGSIVGMVARRSKDQHLEVSALYCAAPHRGIGTQLVLAAIAAADDYRDVEIEVFEKNTTARKFFERLGFSYSGDWRESESYSGQKLLRLHATAGLVRQYAKADAEK